MPTGNVCPLLLFVATKTLRLTRILIIHFLKDKTRHLLYVRVNGHHDMFPLVVGDKLYAYMAIFCPYKRHPCSFVVCILPTQQ